MIGWNLNGYVVIALVERAKLRNAAGLPKWDAASTRCSGNARRNLP
jgi:hypothetical protein